MKALKYFLVLSVLVVVFASCQKEELNPANELVYSNQQSTPRSYDPEVCGFPSNFCEKQFTYFQPALLVSQGNDSIGLWATVSNETVQFFPMLLFDGSYGLVIRKGGEVYIGHNSEDGYLNSKNTETVLPGQLAIFLGIEYSDVSSETVVKNAISTALDKVFIQEGGKSTIDITNSFTDVTLKLAKECDYIWASNIMNFVDVFFEAGDASHIEGFVEDAYNDCPEAYFDPTNENPYVCDNYCRNPRCVVDYLLDIDAGLSDYQKRVLVSRYLEETLGLTDEEQNWLTFNDQSDLVYEIYNGLLSNQNLGRCDKEDCGLLGAYHELIKQEMAGEALSADDVEGLLQFFSLLRCDNPSVYHCFREAQQNPSGDVAAFLNEVIEMTEVGNNFLVDGCDDLTPYVDRWNWLAGFDPMSVQEVSDKLDELGDEYWIQTIENATNVNWWWEASPTVNMDFFGITITELPDKPYPPFDQFTPEEFFDYVQDNFPSSTFLGDGSGEELFNWTGATPITSTFEINMFDDGSVMCTDFNEGQNWTFSTLNAPGWLEGDSYDGFHPVSGNRQFGIIENGDGTYTFYTSGVDRLTGWWHVLSSADTNVPFDIAEELWKCFLDQIREFVEGLGGEVLINYDCTNVRPDLGSLQDIIEQGCGGDPTSFDEFPCHQTQDCP